MKSISIKGTKREVVGKKEAKRLRYEGLVPGVIYGGEAPIHFYAPEKAFKPLIYTPNVYLVDLDIDGTVYQSIIQDTQFHPVEERLLHVDFLRTSDDKMVKVEIPVKAEGFAKGIRNGGKLKINLRTLKVRAMVKHLPDFIGINVEDLDLGQSFKAGSLVRENLEFLNAKAVPVITIMITRAAKAAKAGAKE
ncbi:MAG TPA: 50S ribosomal protein L25/general stress protein Ctc [Prolixibacteraceae bacterium]|nr:50S ribosomal protein L25/general stress protein Ctc [Prolixibacteraceae bacterium]